MISFSSGLLSYTGLEAEIPSNKEMNMSISSAGIVYGVHSHFSISIFEYGGENGTMRLSSEYFQTDRTIGSVCHVCMGMDHRLRRQNC
jgi:hypothetical protein